RSGSDACHGHRGSAFPGAVECGAGPMADTTTPAARRALSVRQSVKNGSAAKRSAVIGAGCNARNVRAIKADVGQFAVAKLGQFVDIALVVQERLDHANEREQHGSLLVSTIQLLEEASSLERI